VYDPDRPEQIAERVLELQRSPALHEQLRHGALEYARGRSWQSTMDQLIDYYGLAIRLNRHVQWRKRLRQIFRW
jgi:glycosyltransferase involved in cell wall biosynthesis